MTPEKLREQDRRFFGLVARAAFINPFSDTRRELQRQLVEFAGVDAAPLTEGALADRAVEIVALRVREFGKQDRADIDSFGGIDRQLLRTALLYDIYHRFIDDFDGLIREQVDKGDRSCPVPFAGRILGAIEKQGFTHDEALLYLGFFFQLNRAYFFIRRGLIGDSPSMKELRRQLWDSVFTSDIRWYEEYLWSRMEDFSTLLLGETGTGKGTAAAAIGRSIFIPFNEKSGCFAESFTRNFIAINLSGFPETIIESELFGHKKGAFTGAVDNYDGVFARSSAHGAILLDEIGDVSPHVQLKLLRILQERTFSPVGSHETVQFRSRVIAATNRPLDDLRRRGEMRDDFFYRLCSNTITVPPLRTRIRENPRELDLLLDHVVRRTLGRPSEEMARTIRRILAGTVGGNYGWPGNVRELEQAVRRIVITRRYDGDQAPRPTDRHGRLHGAIDRGESSAREILAAYCAMLYERHGTYEAVSQVTALDRRTVKKYIMAAQ